MKKTALTLTLALSLASAGFPADAQRSNPRRGAPAATPNLRPLTQPILPYTFAPALVPSPGQVFQASSVALTPKGGVVVFYRNPAQQMVEYTADLKLIRAFSPNLAVNPHGMRIDRHGNIWATDAFLNVVWKLTAKGEPMMMFGRRGEVGPWTDGQWNGMFNQPVDVAFDQDDNFYVVQGHAGTSEPPNCTYCATYENTKPVVPAGSDPRVMKFDKTGKLLATTALPHGPTERYPFIHAVVVTPTGEVWVGDRQSNKIIVLDRNLQRLREITLPVMTSGLAIDGSGNVWVSSGHDGLILKLDAAGKIVGWIGKAGDDADPNAPVLGEAHYLAVSADQKTIFVADSNNAKVAVLKRR